MREEAHEGFEVAAWAGVVGPAGRLSEVVASANAASRRVWDRPETVRRSAGIGFEAKRSMLKASGAFIRDGVARWDRMARAAGIEPE